MKTVDILAFGAHPDDVEIGCSGTLLHHHSLGYTSGIIDLTAGELGTRGTRATRKTEAAAASKLLDIQVRENLNIGDGFFEIEKEALLKIIDTIRTYKPQIVLCNAQSDRHPDHGRGGDLVSRACFLSGLPKIVTNHPAHRPKVVYRYIQDRYIQPDFVVDITPFMNTKLASIAAYTTQFYDPNSTEPETPISSQLFWDGLKARAIEFGRQIGADYGEGFTTERYIGVHNLFDLH